jgi:hypothetical protein
MFIAGLVTVPGPDVLVGGYPGAGVPCAWAVALESIAASDTTADQVHRFRKPSTAIPSFISSARSARLSLMDTFGAEDAVRTLKSGLFHKCPASVNCVKPEVSPISPVSL